MIYCIFFPPIISGSDKTAPTSSVPSETTHLIGVCSTILMAMFLVVILTTRNQQYSVYCALGAAERVFGLVRLLQPPPPPPFTLVVNSAKICCISVLGLGGGFGGAWSFWIAADRTYIFDCGCAGGGGGGLFSFP